MRAACRWAPTCRRCPPGGKGTAPSFVVWAVKDPTSGNLDRIQVIKGWTQNGQSFEKVYDVAWSGDRKPDKWTGRVPAIQSTVDLDKATYTNDVGSAELKTVWTDPEFDASLHAFYYARVLEIPTPRWTLIQAVKAGLPPPDIVPLTGQERAWSSPIWYTPSAEARKNAPAGMTVADLKTKGAAALNDAQLKALIVGKAFWLRNNVTGEQFSQNFTAEGRRSCSASDPTPSCRAASASVAQDGYEGTTSRYKIEGGKLITCVSQDPYAFTFYKLGDTYYAARSNEFGYANYEIIPAPQIAANPLTALSNQFSIELGLTEQQKAQIVPILQQEIKQLGELKKDTTLSGVQKVEELQQARRLLRREDLAAAQSGAAAEVPGHARADAAADDRGDGRQRRRRKWKRSSPTCTSSVDEPAGRGASRDGIIAACADLCEHHETPPPRAAGPLPADRRGSVRRLRLHAVRTPGDPVVEGDPAVARRDRPAHPAVPVAVAPPADAAGARAHGREQGPAGSPLPRGARDGPRQGRRDRQAPHGAEDAVPGRGRGRRARADDGRAQELVREEQRQVRAAAPAELPALVLLARPARRPRARRCGAGAGEARRPAGGRDDRELARRSVHVPGLLP